VVLLGAGAAAGLLRGDLAGRAGRIASGSIYLWLLVLALAAALRAYLAERSQRDGLEFLYAASEVLHGARDLEAGLAGLLDFARDVFRADVAELVLRAGEDGRAYRSGVGPGPQRRLLAAVPLESITEVLALVDGATRAVAQQAPGAALASRDGFVCRSLLVAPLVDDAGVHGAVLLARSRERARFGRETLRLFETFANHLSTSLERARLHTSLAQLRQAERQLVYQLSHDPLTGLANRVCFAERVDAALDAARRDGGRVAVLFIDLDDFKTVNDTMGHAAGDALLEEVGRRIARCVTATDTAARLGGDEFAVLLQGAHEMQARAVADRILIALGDPIHLGGEPVVMQASIGIATHEDARDAAELMQHADVAMYTAKRNGKGRFDEFEPTMSLSVARRHQIKVGLEHAIDRDELVVQYQPVVDVASGRLAAVEALLRWKNPTRGLMSPTEFVGVAEETGLIVPIGRFVLGEACRQAAQWCALEPDLRVFVNLSARQLSHPDLVRDVRTALASSGLRPQQLQLEVTETAMMADVDQAAETLRTLRLIGVGVAIDDFGTGFSSLSYLRKLPIDVLKIAKPIVDLICESEEDAAFVRGIVELGHVIGLSVVAEGVERVEQYARLVAMGCDYVQGFYYASSMEPNDVLHVLAHASCEPGEVAVAPAAVSLS
jgi:diguanylate cyclase (GGDEF)-like protein